MKSFIALGPGFPSGLAGLAIYCLLLQDGFGIFVCPYRAPSKFQGMYRHFELSGAQF